MKELNETRILEILKPIGKGEKLVIDSLFRNEDYGYVVNVSHWQIGQQKKTKLGSQTYFYSLLTSSLTDITLGSLSLDLFIYRKWYNDYDKESSIPFKQFRTMLSENIQSNSTQWQKDIFKALSVEYDNISLVLKFAFDTLFDVRFKDIKVLGQLNIFFPKSLFFCDYLVLILNGGELRFIPIYSKNFNRLEEALTKHFRTMISVFPFQTFPDQSLCIWPSSFSDPLIIEMNVHKEPVLNSQFGYSEMELSSVLINPAVHQM